MNNRIGPLGKLERFCLLIISEQYKYSCFQTGLEDLVDTGCSSPVELWNSTVVCLQPARLRAFNSFSPQDSCLQEGLHGGATLLPFLLKKTTEC